MIWLLGYSLIIFIVIFHFDSHAFYHLVMVRFTQYCLYGIFLFCVVFSLEFSKIPAEIQLKPSYTVKTSMASWESVVTIWWIETKTNQYTHTHTNIWCYFLWLISLKNPTKLKLINLFEHIFRCQNVVRCH